MAELILRIDQASPDLVPAFTTFCVDANQRSVEIYVENDPDGNIRGPNAVIRVVDENLVDRDQLVAITQGLLDRNRWGSVFSIVPA